jgi:aryl-alcohol dehydrogenase-like predicted oxidoreductase
MKFKALGKSGLEISPIGLGTWAIAGPNWAFGWGPQNDADSLAALERGLEGGINWIDTAPVYGLGHAETLVGYLLKRIPANKRPLIFSKCSVTFDDAGEVGHSLKADSITQEIEDSLTRLGVEVIDLMQIHWPSFPPGSPAPDIEEAIEALNTAKKAGKIQAIGVSNFDVDQMKRAQSVAQIDSLQPPYSAIVRGVEEEILPYALSQDIGVIGYSSMQSGLLSGKMTRERVAALPDDDWRKTMSPEFQEPQLSRNLELVEVMRGIGARHGQEPAIVAIAWVLANPALTGAIVGARNATQAAELLPALTFRLSDTELAEIAEALPTGAGAGVVFEDA